jgi:small subunit ribosomal protein S20
VEQLPNIKSAIKRVKVIKVKTLRNSMIKTALRTSIRKCKEAIANNDPKVVEALKSTIRAIDKSVSKNILHKNTAARKKSSLVKAINALTSK